MDAAGFLARSFFENFPPFSKIGICKGIVSNDKMQLTNRRNGR